MKKHEEFSEAWPQEAFDEQMAVVWSDSSYASQAGQKSQGALALTHCLAPVFWKCARQGLVSLSTVEAELQMLCGRS